MSLASLRGGPMKRIHRNLQNTIADVAVLVVLAAPLLVLLA